MDKIRRLFGPEVAGVGEVKLGMEPKNQDQLCWIRNCDKKKTSVWSTTSAVKLPVFEKGEFQMWFTSRKRLPTIKILHIPWRSSSWWRFFTT
jgi:hypothetical protein